MAKQRDNDYMYYRVTKDLRASYDSLIQTLTFDSLLTEMQPDLEKVELIVQKLFVCKDDLRHRVTFSPAVLKPLYLYAYEGFPFFVKRRKDGEWIDCAGDQLDSTESRFLWELDTYLEMIELLHIGEETASIKADSPAGLIVVINTAFARARLDIGVLDPDSNIVLSMHDLVLLGRVSDRFLRNCTSPRSPSYLETMKDSEGSTVVKASIALEWLKGRRGFVPTQYPQNPDALKAMTTMLSDYI